MKEIKVLYENEENEIKDLLFGRKVIKVGENILELDNGLILEINANEG
jgi:hypothetical protein